MGYSKEVHQAVQTRLDLLRMQAIQENEERKEQFFKFHPEAQAIEQELAKTSVNVAKAILKGNNAKQELQKLRVTNLKLQAKLNAILESAGVEKDYLDIKFHCDLCEDTGNVDGKTCSCAIKMLKEEAYKRINSASNLTPHSFDEFDLKYYSTIPIDDNAVSPRKRMTDIFNYCKKYVRDFNITSKGLLMIGGTGLGKTHLSLSIAKEVTEKGFGVVYCSIPTVLLQLEKEHFSYDSTKRDSTIEHLLSCDLLILDDLGTEFQSKFALSTLYNIVNSRCLSSLPTIISTNIPLKQIEEYYSQRMVSRIIANCVKLDFIGQDIRQIKNM